MPLQVSENKNCYEFYVVEKTIHVVVTLAAGGDATIRIDALRDMRSGEYSTTAYIERRFKLTLGDGEVADDSEFAAWVDFELPWTNRATADDALNQALSWLSQKCKQRE